MTDNITPQVPQTRAPMTASDIIRRLETVRTVYPAALGGDLDEEEAKELEALTAAVQAVELLEEIKKELRGECAACKFRERREYEYPCCDCVNDGEDDKWESRWPLGEEADHENK
ncbi:MAG: hypothetical protein LUC35_00065 [Clostridiales bacterium]|nr:hypothetical protein [Clostridiales bacterium]